MVRTSPRKGGFLELLKCELGVFGGEEQYYRQEAGGEGGKGMRTKLRGRSLSLIRFVGREGRVVNREIGRKIREGAKAASKLKAGHGRIPLDRDGVVRIPVDVGISVDKRRHIKRSASTTLDVREPGNGQQRTGSCTFTLHLLYVRTVELTVQRMHTIQRAALGRIWAPHPRRNQVQEAVFLVQSVRGSRVNVFDFAVEHLQRSPVWLDDEP
eukprot:1710275-Rhodomonas_salina.1